MLQAPPGDQKQCLFQLKPTIAGAIQLGRSNAGLATQLGARSFHICGVAASRIQYHSWLMELPQVRMATLPPSAVLLLATSMHLSGAWWGRKRPTES